MGAIYSIINKENGKIYVGLTTNHKRRWNEHRAELNRNDHYNDHLQNSWNKYGADAFEFNILERCEDNSLEDNERWWIDYFGSDNPSKGYNLTSGGNANFIVSDEVRKKLSESRKGKLNSFYGRTHSDETKRYLSEINSGENHPQYGTHHSIDTQIKMSSSRNTSGYFRVCKKNDKSLKQGFTWIYRYYDDDGNVKSLSSVSIDKLKDKVINQGLEWRKIAKGGDMA